MALERNQELFQSDRSSGLHNLTAYPETVFRSSGFSFLLAGPESKSLDSNMSSPKRLEPSFDVHLEMIHTV
jgi:hypothetical protein